MRTLLVSFSLALLPFATATLPLTAQTVKGKVIDAGTGQPLADVSVVLLEGGKPVRGALSNPDGSYELVAPKGGSYVIRIGGPGLERWDSPPLKLEKDQTFEFPIQARREGQGRMEAFERRKAAGSGVFLMQKELEAKGGSRFTDLLRQVERVRVVDLATAGSSGGRAVGVLSADTSRNVTSGVKRGAAPMSGYYTIRLEGSRFDAQAAGARQVGEPTNDCPPIMFVDGEWWGKIDLVSDRGPDMRLLPSDVEAIEIHFPNQVPKELNTSRDAEQCGVIAVWRKPDAKE